MARFITEVRMGVMVGAILSICIAVGCATYRPPPPRQCLHCDRPAAFVAVNYPNCGACTNHADYWIKTWGVRSEAITDGR